MSPRPSLREIQARLHCGLTFDQQADLAREVLRLRKALREAMIFSECPCCMELVSCVSDCEHEATASGEYADLQWRRAHNEGIANVLAESIAAWPE